MLITFFLLPELLNPVALSLIASLIDSALDNGSFLGTGFFRALTAANSGHEQPKIHPRGTQSDPRRATRGGQRPLLEAA